MIRGQLIGPVHVTGEEAGRYEDREELKGTRMRRIDCQSLLLVLVGVAALAPSLLAATPASAQSVTTNPSEYRPGNTVTIIGSGWAPGEAISLVISESTANHPDVSLSATADANGNFMNEGFEVPDNSLDTIYTVTASGSSGWTAQTTFIDPPKEDGSLCAEVTGHGASVCSGLTNDPAGVLGTGQTHYAQVVGSTADYQIRWLPTETPNYDPEADTANGCAVGQVLVQIKSSHKGNTLVCGTVDPTGQIISFSWPAPDDACFTTIVAYRTGTTPGGGNPQFTNADNDVIKDDADGGKGNASAGIGYVASGTPPLEAVKCKVSVTTEIHLEGTHTPVTTVDTDSFVHDKATVTGTAIPIPTGTVDFTFFNTNDCRDTGKASGTVPLVSGIAHPSFSQGPLIADFYGFRAHYNGDDNYRADDGPCEPLTVIAAGPSTGSLMVCKYEDSNINGVYEQLLNEPLLDGWSMTISSVDGVLENATQVTGSTGIPGCVIWTDLTPGSYTVREAPPAGGTPWFNTDPGAPAAPGTPCLISGSSVMGWPTCLAPSKSDSVTAGITTMVYFGNVQSAEKGGQKFYDANADGIKNDGSGQVVAGWKITLDGAADNGSKTVGSM